MVGNMIESTTRKNMVGNTVRNMVRNTARKNRLLRVMEILSEVW